jgi:Na+/melibiose symporter-like transporter
MGGAVTAYNMPYQSLGAELTPDYHERTRVMAYKAIIQKFTEIVFFTSIPFMTKRLEQLRIAVFHGESRRRTDDVQKHYLWE